MHDYCCAADLNLLAVIYHRRRRRRHSLLQSETNTNAI